MIKEERTEIGGYFLLSRLWMGMDRAVPIHSHIRYRLVYIIILYNIYLEK